MVAAGVVFMQCTYTLTASTQMDVMTMTCKPFPVFLYTNAKMTPTQMAVLSEQHLLQPCQNYPQVVEEPSSL
eukprot:8351753-Karenia_brevis.AAC.1